MGCMIISPGERGGVITAPASKSHAHRLLICAALSHKPVSIFCNAVSQDIAATANCLNALCADITLENGVINIVPTAKKTETAELYCGESGSTLRFLLPVCGALGKTAVFHTEGRLSERPLAPLDTVLREHGMTIERRGTDILCSGRLRGGRFEIAGGVSSQFISGLLFALPLLGEDSLLCITGKTESRPYITMTERVIAQAGIRFEYRRDQYLLFGNQRYGMSGGYTVEGDWSNAAPLLCMGALSESGVTVEGLSLSSAQGDKAICDILRRFGAEVQLSGHSVFVRRREKLPIEFDAADTPDLVPVVAALATAAEGETHIVNAERLRLKESDRLQTTEELINALGGHAEAGRDTLTVFGTGQLRGDRAVHCKDHRIAMAAAVAANISASPVTVADPDCVNKSYPKFWEDLQRITLHL